MTSEDQYPYKTIKHYDKLHKDEDVMKAIVWMWIQKVTPREAHDMLEEYYRRQAE